jgi:hypothetical protein
MPKDTRLSALFCPSPVSVHYHGDMARQALGIEGRKHFGIL